MENNIKWINIVPVNGVSFHEQLESCFSRLNEYIKDNKKYNIIHQSFFVKSESNHEYSERKKEISGRIRDSFSEIPSTSVIGQLPDDDYLVTAELLVFVNKPAEIEISYNSIDGIYYTKLSSECYDQIFAGGITTDSINKDFLLQADTAFGLMKKILDSESMTFSNIVRQWNYVENILNINVETDNKVQNYQVLNDIRARYYSQADFKNGYPAATGIGMNTGGIILEFIAIKPKKSMDIIPLKNPEQTDAYNYSQDVLVGNSSGQINTKASPKFERAKYISVNEKKTIFVSGTAAIRNEKTLAKNDIKKQTEITIDNIANLISRSNLKNAGIDNHVERIGFSFVRVYVKNKSQLNIVKEICNSYYKNVPVNYLVADICRDNLLVEIEGIVELE